MRMSLNNAKLKQQMNERGVPGLLVYPQMAGGAWSDEDWGSAGPACLRGARPARPGTTGACAPGCHGGTWCVAAR